MNRTPRLLNRILLALLGVLLMVSGAHVLLVVAVPAYARWSSGGISALDAAVRAAIAGTRTGGREASWLWLGVAAVLVLLFVLVVLWAVVQGRGRTTSLSRQVVRDGEARGVVDIAATVPEVLLKDALAGRADVLRVGVSAWEQRGGVSGLRVRIEPRPGADPLRLAQDVEELVLALDDRLGVRGPVVLDLVTGARARFARTERVR